MPPEPRKRSSRYPPTSEGGGSAASSSGLSVKGTCEAVSMPPGRGSADSLIFCPQYMQNAGGPSLSAVERLRLQRGHVTNIANPWPSAGHTEKPSLSYAKWRHCDMVGR